MSKEMGKKSMEETEKGVIHQLQRDRKILETLDRVAVNGQEDPKHEP